MKTLKRISVILLLFTISGFLLVHFKSQILKALSYNECDIPILYKLGQIDPKFGLSQTAVSADVQEAANIWGKAYGKPLFSYSSAAALTINFVYDQRTALDTHINQLQDQLNKENENLQQQINSYNSDLAAYEKKLSDFNKRVNDVNKSGGASPDLYKQLVAEKKALAAEGDSLNSRAHRLNLATHDFNSQVQNLNQSVDQFNQTITQQPEEGLYSGADGTITIYFADNHAELIHTLTHEFGHALGMLHTTDSQSIMYPYTTASITVTSQDKQQLADVCKERLLPELWLQYLVDWLSKK